MAKNIFVSLEKNYITKLFDGKKLIYFPEQKDAKPVAVEIEKKSPPWQKETCLVRYKVKFGGGDYKIIWGAAGQDDSRKNAWKVMAHLFRSGFNQGQELVAKPIDYLEENNLLLYEEVDGTSLSAMFQKVDGPEIKKSIIGAAKWLSKLHAVDWQTETLPLSRFLEAGDYLSMFAKIKELMPDLERELASASEFNFIAELLGEEKALIHNDYYPGNIIVGKKATGGIDFEKSGVGWRLMDAATLFAWFEFPVQFWTPNFSQKERQNLQNIFLESYCAASKLDCASIRRKVNKLLAKVFLDQVHICATLAVGAWDHIGIMEKKNYQEKIRASLKKARHYMAV